jgi:hypothetical protein
MCRCASFARVEFSVIGELSTNRRVIDPGAGTS